MEIGIVTLDATRMTGVRAAMPQPDIPRRLPQMFDTVHSTLGRAGHDARGPNVALYRGAETGMEVTAAVDEEAAAEGLTVYDIPGGRALHVRHVGAYSGLPGVFSALFAHAEAEGLTFRGYGREVYAAFHPDPARRVTDVYMDID